MSTVHKILHAVQQATEFQSETEAAKIEPDAKVSENDGARNQSVANNAQNRSQKSGDKSNAILSELNLLGQLQQLKMKNLEGGGGKGNTKNPTAGNDSPLSSKEDQKTSSNFMFRGSGGDVTKLRKKMFPRGLLDHTLLSQMNWRKLTTKQKRLFVQDELKERGYSFDKAGLKKAANDGDVNAVKLFMRGDPKRAQQCFLDLVQKGNLKAVQTFLDAGMDPNIRDKKGRTPLMLANGWDVVDALIDKGADTNAVNKKDGNKTVLMYQAEKSAYPLSSKLLEKVKQAGKMNTPDVNGRTALMYAAAAGRGPELDRLILNGADVNAVDKFKNTALTRAVSVDDVAGAKTLLANGAWPGGAYKDDGEAPLTIAVRNGNIEMIKTLLENPYTRVDYDANGESVIDIARSKGRDDIVALLMAKAQEHILSKMSDIEKIKAGGNQP